ncbi:hypothetical protein EZV62_019400 [Acer yangbiense]|uniref:Cyclin-like domain-containing protein n=1 Tax=Acer yangbiense TaxID=1000413 RepID=A0A5C7HB04_9ROSI|nr:hypothetical protein EZV62_019400 [Acer yangbiense]
MAANFWTSSHHKQLMDQDDVDVVQPLDRDKGITLEDFKLIKMHMSNYISKLAQYVKVRQRTWEEWWTEADFQGWKGFSFMKKLEWVKMRLKIWNKDVFGDISKEKHELRIRIAELDRADGVGELCEPLKMERNQLKLKLDNVVSKEEILLRQKAKLDGPSKRTAIQNSSIWVVATAVTYMRRFYTRKSMTEYDPHLVAPTCLYLASKAEESTVQARLLVFYIKKIYSDEKYRYEVKDILEMEMKILEALNYYLVVFHPYRSLVQFLPDAGMNDISMTHLSWGLVNDTYKMDLILVYPPHLIALACIYIASVYREKDNTAWFEELRVDMNVVKTISMEILDFYEGGHRMVTDERINAASIKLGLKPETAR